MKYMSQSNSWKYGPSGTMYSCSRMPLGGLMMWRFSSWLAMNDVSDAGASAAYAATQISADRRVRVTFLYSFFAMLASLQHSGGPDRRTQAEPASSHSPNC